MTLKKVVLKDISRCIFGYTKDGKYHGDKVLRDKMYGLVEELCRVHGMTYEDCEIPIVLIGQAEERKVAKIKGVVPDIQEALNG